MSSVLSSVKASTLLDLGRKADLISAEQYKDPVWRTAAERVVKYWPLIARDRGPYAGNDKATAPGWRTDLASRGSMSGGIATIFAAIIWANKAILPIAFLDPVKAAADDEAAREYRAMTGQSTLMEKIGGSSLVKSAGSVGNSYATALKILPWVALGLGGYILWRKYGQ